MTKETYMKMTGPFREHREMARAIHIGNKMITGLIFLSYPLLLLYYLKMRDGALVRAIVVPLDSFIVITVFRYLVDRQRPYEKFEMPPIIHKETRGKSFPSRHVFSAFIIAMTYLLFSPWQMAGAAMLVMASLLAVIRVLSGVHFVSDVAAGAVAGILTGIIGYLVIP